MSILKVVHVNSNIIRSNAKRGENTPPLVVRGKSKNQPREYGHEVDLILNGEVVGTFVYRPNDPLDCGARVWLETDKLEVVARTFEEKKDERKDCTCSA